MRRFLPLGLRVRTYRRVSQESMLKERGGATMDDKRTGMRGAHVVVDGEELTVEDTVMAAVCAGRLSPDLLDHGFDTYWCVTEDGHHRLLRASELCLTGT
jgi:hypothetical protein